MRLLSCALMVCLSLGIVGGFALQQSELEAIVCSAEKSEDCVDSIIVTIKPKFSAFDKDQRPGPLRGFKWSKITELSKITSEAARKAIPIGKYHQIYKVDLEGDQRYSFSAIKSLLGLREEVLSVEADRTSGPASTIPNDPDYTNQNLWGLYGIHGIKAPTAWDTTTGSSNVRVGIIDTGVIEHDDLVGNLAAGWDFVNNNSVTSDDTYGHGTKVAGIIGAVGNNGIGTIGVCWDVSLVPLQGVDPWGLMSLSTKLNILTYATNLWGTANQIDILNHSWGGYGEETSVRSAIYNFPGLFVWAAGNGNNDVDTWIATNGSFNLGNLISVGAIKDNGARHDGWDGSNYSSADEFGSIFNLNIFAPGSGIYTTNNDGCYHTDSGTSMAAAFVTGAAALALAHHPHLTSYQLKNLLLYNSTFDYINIPTTPSKSVYALFLDASTFIGASSAAHLYETYAYDSPSQHRHICECGDYELEPHAVRHDEIYYFNGHRYAHCINCGALLNLDSGIVIVEGNGANGSLIAGYGSYSLPNGILVIAEEDMQSYLNGTLQWYPSNQAGA